MPNSTIIVNTEIKACGDKQVCKQAFKAKPCSKM